MITSEEAYYGARVVCVEAHTTWQNMVPVGATGRVARPGIDGDGDVRIVWDKPQYNDPSYRDSDPLCDEAWAYTPTAYLASETPVDTSSIESIEEFLS